MHLLADYTPSDFAAWKRDFDAEAEDRMNAGLTLLQMWRDADAGTKALCLFEVNDRGRAEAWLHKESALGAPVTARFLRTA